MREIWTGQVATAKMELGAELGEFNMAELRRGREPFVGMVDVSCLCAPHSLLRGGSSALAKYYETDHMLINNRAWCDYVLIKLYLQKQAVGSIPILAAFRSLILTG